MSHLINIRQQIQPIDILKGSIYEIIIPKLGNLKKNSVKVSNYFTKQEGNKLIKNIVRKESILCQEFKQRQLREEFNVVKQRMKTYGDRESYKKINSLDLYKQKQNNRFKISLPQKVNKIYIDQKYNNLLALRMDALKQVEEIQNYRMELKTLQDKKLNAITKSPNFNKMLYLLEKVNEQKVDHEIFDSTRKRNEEMILKQHNHLHNYIGLSKICHQKYMK